MDVSKQNYALYELRTAIDKIEDVKTLEKNKKETPEEYMPISKSFFVFFNYYYLMFTRSTFEVGEENDRKEHE